MEEHNNDDVGVPRRIVREIGGTVIPSAEGTRYFNSTTPLPEGLVEANLAPLEPIQPRRDGCQAVPEINGSNFSLPVCMGGTALVGCNNPEECVPLYVERNTDPYSANFILRTEDGSRVTGITTVPRQPVTNSAEKED